MSADFIYVQIKNYLMGLIENNRSSPMYKLPSEKQLAIKFGCDRICAKRAFNDLEKDGVIYRMQGKGSFIQPDGSPMLHKNKSICMMAPNFDRRYILDMMFGVEDFYFSLDVSVFFAMSRSKADGERRIIDSSMEKKFDGMIVFPSSFDNYNTSVIKHFISKYPIVFVGRSFPGLNTSRVCSNHYLHTRLAMDYLYDKGHREIAFICERTTDSETHGARRTSYMDFVKKKLNDSIHFCDVDFDTGYDPNHPHILLENARRRIFAFLDEHREITAIVATDLALNYINEYMKINHIQKEKMAIVTFDKPENTAISYDGELMAVDQQPYKMGYLAAEQLYAQITNKAQAREIFVEPILVSM